jgi:plastocyanin
MTDSPQVLRRTTHGMPERQHPVVRRARLATALGLLAAGLLTGCGLPDSSASISSSTPPLSGSPTAAPAKVAAVEQTMTKMIHIRGFTFMSPDSVSPGSTVTVMNLDQESHTVTAAEFGVTALPGRSATFTAPAKPGIYPFHCSSHSTMQGSLVVE